MVLNILHRITKGESSPEAVARRATNDDIFGPSTDDLQRLMTHIRKAKACAKVFHVLEQRLVQNSRHWRRKSKTLTVLQYFLVSGNPTFFVWIQEHAYLIENLLDFRYLDSKNKDQGRSVRDKAKGILAVVKDPSRLEEARRHYKEQREGFRKSIGTGRPSTASRNTLEAFRDSILEDPDPGDIDGIFHFQNPPVSSYEYDESNSSMGGLGIIQEEH